MYHDPGQSGGPKPRRSKPHRNPEPSAPRDFSGGGDVGTSGGNYGIPEAKRAARSNPTVRRNTRFVYQRQPQAQRSRIAATTRGRSDAVSREIQHEHQSRVARNRELAASLAQNPGGGDMPRAQKYLAQHPEILHPQQKGKGGNPLLASVLNNLPIPLAAGASTTIGDVKKLHIPVGKMENNAFRDALDIPANIVPSTYKLAKDTIHNPIKGAQELAQPYVDFAKHPVKQFVNHPLGTALLFTGAGRGADLAVGRAITRATGNVAERAARVVPDTALKETPRLQRGLIHGSIQKARDARNIRKKGLHAMTAQEIRRRVDERVSAGEDIRRLDVPEAVHHATEALKGTRKVQAAVSLRAQQIIKSKEDAIALRDRVQSHIDSGKLEGKYKAAAEKNIKLLNESIKHWDQAKIDNAAEAYRVLNVTQQGELGKLYGQSTRLAKARLMPHAVERMGQEPGPIFAPGEKPGVAAGKVRFSEAQIRANLKAEGMKEPAFVTHALDQGGAKNFFVPTEKPAALTPSGRTGLAVEHGTLPLTRQALIEQNAKTAGLITTAKEFARTVGEFAVRKDSGRGAIRTFKTYRDAKNAADKQAYGRLANGEVVQMRPVRINPFGAQGDQLERMLERANSADPGDPYLHSLHDAMVHAVSGAPSDGAGPWVLMPESAADQLTQHLQRMRPGTAQRVFNLYGTQFRRTVLALSPKWLTGNVVEAALRSMVGGVTPADLYRGKKALARARELNPTLERQAQVRIAGGGHYSLVRRNNVRSEAEHFAGTKLAGVAEAMGKLRRTPGPKQIANVWNSYTDFVFHTLNGRIETNFQTAMLGKALRDSHLMNGSVLKLSNRAIDQAAHGLLHTNEQVRLAREVDRMYGQYSKFNPTLRRAVASYTPFIAWSLNAINFLTRVLPADHPALTSLMASANQATEEWRKSKDLELMMKGALPAFLQGSIPGKNGSHLRVSRYTPFGIASSPSENLANTILPQAMTIIQAANGKDWKGNDLPTKGTPMEEQGHWLAMAQALIEGSIPAVAIAHNLSGLPDNLGGKSNKALQVRKQFDPFMYTQASKTAAKKKGGEFSLGSSSSHTPGEFSLGGGGGSSHKPGEFKLP